MNLGGQMDDGRVGRWIDGVEWLEITYVRTGVFVCLRSKHAATDQYLATMTAGD